MKQNSVEALRYQFKELFKSIDDITTPFIFNERFREFGVSCVNGPNRSVSVSFIRVNFCPFTGKSLPQSLRFLFFDELEKLGYEDTEDERLPERYKTSEWWSD